MKNFGSQLGGKLGVGMCAAGFLALFLGWNGAASVDRVESQFPYLISGGVLGLSLVLCGIGLLVIQNQRADRAELQSTLRELRQAMAEAGLATTAAGTDQRAEFSLPSRRPTPAEYRVAPAPDAAEPAPIEVVFEPDDDARPVAAATPRTRKAPNTATPRRKKPLTAD